MLTDIQAHPADIQARILDVLTLLPPETVVLPGSLVTVLSNSTCSAYDVRCAILRLLVAGKIRQRVGGRIELA